MFWCLVRRCRARQRVEKVIVLHREGARVSNARSRAEFASGIRVAAILVSTPLYPDATYSMNGSRPQVGLKPYTPFAAAGTLWQVSV